MCLSMEFNDMLCAAAEEDYVDVLKWSYRQGCHWNDYPYLHHARNDYLHQIL